MIDLVMAAARRLEQGDRAGALAAASEACFAEPSRPDAHYVYGQAWSALGDHPKAERAFAAALQLAPRWADAWVNYGLARYRQGHIQDAKTAMRQARLSEPGHRAATANLGAFMRVTGEGEGAEALLREAVARAPDDPGARLNLVADLLDEERAEEALALLREAPAVPREISAARHWRLQESLALLQLHRVAEARASLEGLEALGPLPPELIPLWRWRRVLLARHEGDRPRAFEEATLMEQALGAMGPNAVLDHAIMAHFSLAKFLSGEGAPSRAFAHWVEGHRILGRSQPFSREQHRAFVAANIALFDATRFRAGPRAGNRDAAPVFIVGMPRSGTTLVEQILGAHGLVHAAGERSALGHVFAALGGGETAQAVERLAACDTTILDQAAERYLADLHALAPDKGRIVDKLPGNFNRLALVGLMLPGARIIHCARDPRDVGLSIFTFRFHGLHPYAHDLGDLGWYIGQHDRLMAHWKATLPNPILTVQLADWVEDFDATLAAVLAHLDLPPDPKCARFYEGTSRVRTVSRAQVRQPVNARGLGRWRTFERELAPLIAALESPD